MPKQSFVDHMRNISVITGVMVTLGGGAVATAYAAGWITNKDGVRKIAQAEVDREEAERLQFQLEYKNSLLRQLNSIEDPSADDEEQKRELRKQIDAIEERIAKLQENEA